MSNHDAPEGMAPMDPPPDEDAWEAYVEFTLKLLGADGSNAVTNSTVTVLETALGHPLPIEVAMLLLIGVPDGDKWQRWGDDPASELETWQTRLAADLESAHGPGAINGLGLAAQLIPIYDGKAVPAGIAEGHDSADANPVFAVANGQLSVAANDLAAWLHAEFDMPLPWWPDTPPKRFLFWSDLVN